ncbi:hypothetical protein COW46_05435 [Candidatus Gracilibacteria bacterium CG17_big_fil_post_rev_8_21_14_2_50_48_13]|nr:MAG: hypothetical protein COW46_05435 [Candidatus Gracilibacteria bacterium CG17_big_fil_post_rev_8_21_14_2_50_48_13]
MRLSYSHLYTYAACPKRYWYTYREKLPTPLWWQASFGTSLHNALYRFTQEVQGTRLWKSLENGLQQPSQMSLFFEATPTLPPIERLLELFDSAWVSVGYADHAAMYAAKEEGMHLLRNWYMHHAKELLETVAVEIPFHEQVGSCSIGGRIDRIDRRNNELIVIDYKSGKLRSAEETALDLQLSLYALVLHDYLGLDSIALALYFLREDALIETRRSKEQCEETRAYIHQVGKQITKEEFSPTPSPDTCTQCPFRTLCPDSVCSSPSTE